MASFLFFYFNYNINFDFVKAWKGEKSIIKYIYIMLKYHSFDKKDRARKDAVKR
jgi:hypothetical protein